MISIKSSIIPGKGEAGSVYGAPTLNLAQPIFGFDGVYAGLVHTGESEMQAAVCIGAQPGKCEFHALTNNLPEMNGEIILTLLARVSRLTPWESEDQMREKIHSDIVLVRRYFDES